VGRLQGVYLGDNGAIEDLYKVLGVFDWKVKGWKRLHKPGCRGRIGEYWMRDSDQVCRQGFD